jgi:hypothetical protein
VTRDRSRAVDSVALLAAKLALGAWVLHLGFSHVSDDDYARVVISERFAEAPRIDPSGTSWLPFPFWVDGMAMMALGRSLPVARAMAVVLGCASVLAPYFAMRAVRVPRAAALAAAGIAMALPWNAWLGVATVPEGWAGALAAASVVAMGRARLRTWAAAGLLAASLCRYEAWPACVVFAAVCARCVATKGGDLRRELSRALLALSGTAAWMAWNFEVHGSPLHFLARVAAFRHAVGAADSPLSAKVLGYPVALLQESPEAAALGLVGAVGLLHAEVRARWLAPACGALAIFVFLVWGDVHDGAPTHHAARALVAVWWILIGMGVDTAHTLALRMARRRVWRLASTAGIAVAGAAWLVALSGRLAMSPGRSPSEQRDAQISRGLVLRDTRAEHVRVSPCAYEHFALLAAWGAPERATILPASHAPVTPDCPVVSVE